MKENITWVTRGVLVTLSEQLDGDEFFQVNEKVYGDSRFDNLRYQLWDFTKVTEFNVNIEDECRSNALPIAFSDSPRCQRSHISVFCAAVYFIRVL